MKDSKFTNLYTDLVKNISISTEACSTLYHGKAGKVILLYLLSQFVENQAITNHALNMLNEISDNIAKIEVLDFADGLAGIGWAVEWIAQNGFLEMNTNEILEDIDDILYKSVVYARDIDISLSTGILGKFLFFMNRYKSKNLGTHRLKNIFHEECLVLLTDDLYENICGEGGLITKEYLTNNDLQNIGHAIYFLSDFLWLKVNEPTVESTLYETVRFVDDYLEKNCAEIIQTNKTNFLLFLSLCYYLTGRKHQQYYWQERACHYLKFIDSTNRFEQPSLLHSINTIFMKILFDTNRDLPDYIMHNSGTISLGNDHGKKLLYQVASQNLYSTDMTILLLMIF